MLILRPSLLKQAARPRGLAPSAGVLLAVCLLWCCAPAQAANAAAKTSQPSLAGEAASSSMPTEAELSAKRAQARKRLEDIQRLMQKSREAAGNQPATRHLPVSVEALKYLDIVFAQQQAAIRLRAELLEQKQELTAQLELLRSSGVRQDAPHSFLQHDELRDKLAAQKRRLAGLTAEMQTTRSLLDSTRRGHEELQTERRRLQEALSAQQTPAKRMSLSQQLDVVKHKSEAVAEAVRQQQMDVANTELAHDISQLRSEYLEERLHLLAPHVSVSTADLQTAMAQLTAYEGEVRELLDGAQKRFHEADRACQAAKTSDDDENSEGAAREKIQEAWDFAREIRQEEVSLLQQRLREIIVARLHWQRRFLFLDNKASRDQIRQWKSEIDDAEQRLEQTMDLLRMRMEDRRLELATLTRNLIAAKDKNNVPEKSDPRQTGEAHSNATRLIEFQIKEAERLVAVNNDQLTLLSARTRFLKRFQEDLEESVGAAASTRWMATLFDTAAMVWQYEITSIDDRPITVSKITQGLILLIVGFLLSRWISRLLGRRVLKRIGLHDSVALTLQSIAFYVLIACFGFVSLELINIPLTVFAFLGGAIAIGVGFGSQNILNNFISGLIMLAERPIRIGDLVDVDGLTGTVEHIGPRSTRVKTGANLEIIVPNSKFLENNVTNWTLSDTTIRRVVHVGVAYGSPTRRSEALLRQAVHDTPGTMDHPEPIILFGDFGDSSLMFEVHFWVRMRTVMQAKKVESELRHTIDDLFRAADITIAFPQRDIHVDTSKPLEISLRRPLEETPAAPRKRIA